MADARAQALPARASPLHAYAGATLEVRHATIVDRPFRMMLDVRADPGDAAAREALLAATGLTLPAPCRFVAGGGRILAWLGPDEFLLVDAAAADDDSTASGVAQRNHPLRAALEGSVAAVTALDRELLNECDRHLLLLWDRMPGSYAC